MMSHIFVFLFMILVGILPYLFAHQDGELCKSIHQLAFYCASQQHNTNKTRPASQFGRTGKAGPRGHRGPPGVVDYDIINATIDNYFEDIERRIGNRLSAMESTLDGFAQRQDILLLQKEFHKLSTKLQAVEELMTWYKASNNYYYKIYHDKVDYSTARSKCRRQGGNLAAIGIRDSTIRDQLMPLIKASQSDIWIGLDDITNENNFVWADGAAANSGNLNWGEGQPDDSGGKEDCVHYRPAYGWRLNDESCKARNKKYICEKRA